MICPPSKRGHSWKGPELAMLPDVPRRALFALRVCTRCGAFGHVDTQGRIKAGSAATLKELIADG